jgi:predicted nucleic acid-binding protein
MYLLDTSVWIQYLRASEDAFAQKKFTKFVTSPLRDLKISSCGIVLFELIQGAKSPTHQSDVDTIRGATNFIELSEADYLKGGHVSRQLISKSQFLPMADVMLAICALKVGATLVSSDKHFQRIARIEPKLKFSLF